MIMCRAQITNTVFMVSWFMLVGALNLVIIIALFGLPVGCGTILMIIRSGIRSELYSLFSVVYNTNFTMLAHVP